MNGSAVDDGCGHLGVRFQTPGKPYFAGPPHGEEGTASENKFRCPSLASSQHSNEGHLYVAKTIMPRLMFGKRPWFISAAILKYTLFLDKLVHCAISKASYL